MMSIVCQCGTKVEFDFPEMIDLDIEQKLEEEILSGSLLTIPCQSCGTQLKPEVPCRISMKSRGMDLFLIPESNRVEFYRKDLTYEIPANCRVVVGYPELVEKVTIFRSGLDDRAIEILKYTLYSKIIDQVESRADVRILFSEKKQDHLEFYIDGLKDNEIGFSKVPVSAYTRTTEHLEISLKKEPFSRILELPYISMNRIYYEDV